MHLKFNCLHFCSVWKSYTEIWQRLFYTYMYKMYAILKRIRLLPANLFTSLLLSFMVLNTTFNNISVIQWRSVLLVEETGGPGENNRPVASHWQILSHNVVHPWSRFEITTSVVIGTEILFRKHTYQFPIPSDIYN